MEAATDGEGKESSPLRCASDAARYAVASVVTILIVVVVVKAVMVLRPTSLYLSVPGGSVYVTRSVSQQDKQEAEVLLFHFSLLAKNPSNRVLMYYIDIMGHVFSKNMSASSKSDYLTMFRFLVPDMVFPQHRESIEDVNVTLLKDQGSVARSVFFDWLYGATSGVGIISTDLTLRLDGTLITRTIPEGYNTTSGRNTSFYCRPLFASANLGVDASLNKQDAFCVSGDTPTHD